MKEKQPNQGEVTTVSPATSTLESLFISYGVVSAHKTIREILSQCLAADADAQQAHANAWLLIGDIIMNGLENPNPEWTTITDCEQAVAAEVRRLREVNVW